MAKAPHMRKQTINLMELISTLELPARCMDWVKLDYCGALAGLREFKKIIENQRRVLALKYHPDKDGGSLERMKIINGAIDFLLALRIQLPQRQVVVFRSFRGDASSVSTNSTATSSGYW
jgi:hypothetical protein